MARPFIGLFTFLKIPFQLLLQLNKHTARWARLAFLFLFYKGTQRGQEIALRSCHKGGADLIGGRIHAPGDLEEGSREQGDGEGPLSEPQCPHPKTGVRRWDLTSLRLFAACSWQASPKRQLGKQFYHSSPKWQRKSQVEKASWTTARKGLQEVRDSETSESSTPDLQRTRWAGKTWVLERAMALPLTSHRALTCPFLCVPQSPLCLTR